MWAGQQQQNSACKRADKMIHVSNTSLNQAMTEMMI